VALPALTVKARERFCAAAAGGARPVERAPRMRQPCECCLRAGSPAGPGTKMLYMRGWY